ncbi:hypothetical protein ACFQE1_15555, partial [Halobium palmae]
MAESQAVRRGESVDAEEVFDTLSSQRRRFTIHALEREGPMEIGELARTVAAWEYQKDAEAVSSAERRRVYNSLQQVHLPKMDEKGLLDYDADSGVVSPTDSLSQLRLYLEVVPGNDIPWSRFYLLLGSFGLLFAATTALNVPPFGAVPDAVGALAT